jgi:4a-hydroxytetrahydrobiopterin dehydratase
MTSQLAQKECVPCKGGVPPLGGAELDALRAQLDSGWKVVESHHLEREYAFNTYGESVEFANKVAALAEEQNHHPDILLTYGKVKVTVWTHKIDGLTLSDFVFAAKVDKALDTAEGA